MCYTYSEREINLLPGFDAGAVGTETVRQLIRITGNGEQGGFDMIRGQGPVILNVI